MSRNYEEKLSQKIISENYPWKLSASISMTQKSWDLYKNMLYFLVKGAREYSLFDFNILLGLCIVNYIHGIYTYIYNLHNLIMKENEVYCNIYVYLY